MYQNMCRLCAKESVGDSALEIFDQGQRNILIQIKEIAGIMLKNKFGLPKLVCANCIISLKEAYQFRENILKAQELFKTKPPKFRKKTQIQETVIEATEFVQVCYVKEEKDTIKSDVTAAEEKEININDSHVTFKKEKSFAIVSEVNALEINSNDENTLEDVTNIDETEKAEASGSLYKLDCSYDDNGGNTSDVSSQNDNDDNEELYVPEQVTHKKTNRPRRKFNKGKCKTPKAITKDAQVEDSSKETKPRKRRKDAEDHPNLFICDQCGNHFTCRHHFKLHLRRHTGDKQCACELCPDKFFTSSELRRHMRKHTGERPFACKFCERRFTDYSTRIKHERTHTNERPFMCSQCGKSFTTSYILKNHMLTHTGERHFKCDACNKSFTRRTHLVVHFRSIMHKQAVEKEKQQCPQEPQPRPNNAATSIPSFVV